MLTINDVYFDDFVPNWSVSSRQTTAHIAIFVVKGRLMYEIDREKVELAKGDLLLIRPGAIRRGGNLGESVHQKYSAHFNLQPQRENPLVPFLESERFRVLRPRGGEYVKGKFAELYRQWRVKAPYYEAVCTGMLTELLGTTAREAERQRFPSRKLALVAELENYLLQHYREPVKIADLARHIQRSPNYVSAVFREVTGMTPVDYLHRLRVAAARDLLLYSNMSVSAVADYLNFCDPAYFNRVFRKVTGVPPSALIHERVSTE